MLPPKTGARLECRPLPQLFSIVVESLPEQFDQRKKERNKNHPNWKGRSKASLLTDDMTFVVALV